jgi:hypothetical protein
MTLQICDIEKSEELSKEKMAETTGGNGYPSYGNDYGHYGDNFKGYSSYGYGYGHYGDNFKGYPSYGHGYGRYGDLNQKFNGGVNIGNGADNTNNINTINLS